jgi:hypothetical protein
MGPLALGLIGAGAGLGKSILVDSPRAKKEAELAAITATLSPWTGLKAQMPEAPDALGSALQGGLALGQFGQQLKSQSIYDKLLEKELATKAAPTAPIK